MGGPSPSIVRVLRSDARSVRRGTIHRALFFLVRELARVENARHPVGKREGGARKKTTREKKKEGTMYRAPTLVRARTRDCEQYAAERKVQGVKIAAKREEEHA